MPLTSSSRPRLAALLVAGLALFGARPGRAALDVQCEWPPPGGTSVVPESTDVMMTPIVGDLDGDGLPEIVIVTFKDVNDNNRGEDGVLRILSGADCSEIVSVPDPGCVSCFGDAACRSLEERADEGMLCPGCGVAIADLDSDGDMEIVALAEGQPRPDGADPDDYSVGLPRRIIIFDHQGNFVSCSEASPEWLGHLAAPAIADLDGDGTPEIVVRTVVFNADGSLRWANTPRGWGPSLVADLDEDGIPEVVSGEIAYRADGTVLWDRYEDLDISFPAVADLDGDCLPEVVLTCPRPAAVHVLDGLTGATLVSAELPGGLEICPLPRPNQGGAPTLADIDGDYIPEIGVAGCLNYTVFHATDDGMGNLTGLYELWSNPTSDDSSRITASTYFDLQGDGSIEVLYQDQQRLWIYDALSGMVIDTFEHSNSTLIEYPALADVDADGQAEVVIVGNDYFRCCDIGIKVLFDPTQPWTPTRNLLNQHTYHQTNVNDDGTIPAHELPSWRANNNYRAQLVPDAPQREDCAAPPELLCDPQGPYLADCAVDPACPGGVEVLLDAAPNPELDDSGLSYAWTLDCDGDVQQAFERTAVLCAPVTCGGCSLHLEVVAADGRFSECDTELDWEFSSPPLVIDAGPDATAECPDPPAVIPPSVEAACGSPPPPEHERIIEDGPCPGSYTVIDRWSALDACGELVVDERIIEVEDSTAPALEGLPEDLVVACDEVPDPPGVLAVDDCSEAELGFVELRLDGDCPGSYVLERTWSASDECGNSVSATRTVDVQDVLPPTILGVPADLTVACGEVPAPASPSVADDCDADPELVFDEQVLPGPCPQDFDIVRTWTTTDACGNSDAESQTIHVQDLEPPLIVGVPGDENLPCGEIPDPVSPTVSDACDSDPELIFEELVLPGPCPHSFDVVRTWTATDSCGNEAEADRTLFVRDLEPPVLLVPAALVIECTGEGGVSIDDPRIQAWLASASATDDCTEPVPITWDAPAFFPIGCPDPDPQLVTFFAEDECGNEVSAPSSISVVDTTPPEILALDLPGCLWSPNHMYACFPDVGEFVTASDACGGELIVRVEGCMSDQPDEAPEEGDRGGRELGNGDGHTRDDCLIAPDGSGLCARFERQGTDREGRHYSISLVVEDGCGNGVVVPWDLFVPHDQREHPCPNAKRPSKVGPNDPFPWE